MPRGLALFRDPQHNEQQQPLLDFHCICKRLFLIKNSSFFVCQSLTFPSILQTTRQRHLVAAEFHPRTLNHELQCRHSPKRLVCSSLHTREQRSRRCASGVPRREEEDCDGINLIYARWWWWWIDNNDLEALWIKCREGGGFATEYKN